MFCGKDVCLLDMQQLTQSCYYGDDLFCSGLVLLFLGEREMVSLCDWRHMSLDSQLAIQRCQFL